MTITETRGAHRVLYSNAARRANYQPRLTRTAALPPVPTMRSENHLLAMAKAGLLVAEELPTTAREQLFTDLWALGWSDLEMAEHTRTSLYTTARIRDRLGLRPNRPRAEELSA